MEHDGEFVLSHQPLAIYVKFEGATWKVADDLDQGVYPVTARSGLWKVNKRTGVEARRTGFFLIPDFAATAHMVQGKTEDAVFAEATEILQNPMPEEMVTTYVGMSRVKELEKLVVLQPFTPDLQKRTSTRPDDTSRKAARQHYIEGGTEQTATS